MQASTVVHSAPRSSVAAAAAEACAFAFALSKKASTGEAPNYPPLPHTHTATAKQSLRHAQRTENVVARVAPSTTADCQNDP
jgi:hypothetical protein